MKTKSTEFIYQDTKIHFALSTSKNVMVNATEMAKAFNRRTKDFLKTESTKSYINFREQALNGARSKNKIIDNRGHMGIYFDRKLALKFAMWLDVAFENWVIDTIDELLFGEYRIYEEAHQQNLKAEKEIEKLELVLANNEAFQKIQTLKKFIKTKNSEKVKALKERKSQIEMNFKNPE